MKTKQKHTRVLIIAAGMLLLSVLILLLVLPGIYTKTLPNTTNTRALIGISLDIILRLPLLFGYLVIIRRIRNNNDVRGGTYILIGVLLLTFGLIDTDSAFAFLDNKDILYVSLLLFGSIFCDLTAALLTFIAVSLKPAPNQLQMAADKRLLNGLLIGLGVVVLFFFAFPWGILLSLAFWIYLGVILRKKKSFFSPEMEVTIVEKLRKRLRGFLSVALITFPVAILGIILHNIHSGQTGNEESFYFYMGIIAEYVFVLASAGAMVTLLNGRQKQE